MAEQQKTVVFGILFAVVLGIAINWWWPWGDDAEADKDDKEFEVGFSMNVDAHVRYGEPAKSPSRPTPTRIPFLSVDLRNYGTSPTEFLRETSTGNHLQYGGLDLLLTDDVRNYITANEDRSDYLLIFLSEDRRKVERIQIIRNKDVLRKIEEDDIDDITTSTVTDKYGNIFYIPLFTEIDDDDVEKIYVINEYVVYSRNSDGSDVIAIIGIIGFVLLIIGIILLILRIFGAEDIGCLWFVIGGIGALMCSFAASILGGSCCC